MSRLPRGEELYSNGPHLARQSRNRRPGPGRRTGEATLSGEGEGWSLRGNASTPASSTSSTSGLRRRISGLTVRQADARLVGLDVEAELTLARRAASSQRILRYRPAQVANDNLDTAGSRASAWLWVGGVSRTWTTRAFDPMQPRNWRRTATMCASTWAGIPPGARRSRSSCKARTSPTTSSASTPRISHRNRAEPSRVESG